MYLTKRTYVKNWSHMPPEELHQVTVTKNGQPVKEIDPAKVREIVEDAGYWRKANAIHKWFVKNVQDNNDNCGEYPVSHENMESLLALVNEVLEDNAKAPDLLPTARGFFFGGTEYDEYYFDDLRLTKQILEDALKNESGEYYYSSSWQPPRPAYGEAGQTFRKLRNSRKESDHDHEAV